MKLKIIRGIISILLGRIGLTVIGVLTTPLLVRVLGSSQYGDYAFLLSILGISTLITDFGMFNGIRKHISEEQPENNWKELVFSFYFKLGTSTGLIGALIFFTLPYTGIVANVIGPEFNIYFRIAGVILFFRQISRIVRSGLLGNSLEHYAEAINTGDKLIFSLTAVSLAYYGHGIVGVLLGSIIGKLIATGVGFIILSKYINLGYIFKKIPDTFPRNRLLSFNTWNIVLELLFASLYQVDIIVLRLFIGSSQTGLYKGALKIAQFLWLVPISLQLVLLHSTSSLWTDNSVNEISDIISHLTKYNVLLSLILCLGVGSLADIFIPFYLGEEFSAAIGPTLLLLPGVLGFAIARPIIGTITGKGDLKKLIVSIGVSAMINLLLNMLLVPQWGMLGAAVATSTGYGSMLLLQLRLARKLGLSPFSKLPGGRVLLTGIATISVLYLLRMTLPSTTLSLLIVPPIGFISFMIILLMFRIISWVEIREIIRKASMNG